MGIVRVMIIFILFFMVAVCGWAFENDQTQKTVSGTVADMDWVKSVITVNYSNLLSGEADEINIIVPSEAEITRGAQTISLSDIGQSDPVTVVYYDDGLSGLKARRISDLNQGSM
ncbi:MAG: hypothetical protein Q7S42_01070 [Candidatus Omnitrophota bacterium]|nr:hypothetical protein [Candidatus Omnitrophota bacterium]